MNFCFCLQVFQPSSQSFGEDLVPEENAVCVYVSLYSCSEAAYRLLPRCYTSCGPIRRCDHRASPAHTHSLTHSEGPVNCSLCVFVCASESEKETVRERKTDTHGVWRRRADRTQGNTKINMLASPGCPSLSPAWIRAIDPSPP